MYITQYLLLTLIAVPFLGFLFSLTARKNNNSPVHNVMNVVLFVIVSNMALLWYIWNNMNLQKSGLQLLETYHWQDVPPITLVWGVDIFSLMLILSIHIMFLIGISFVKNTQHPKMLGSLSLLLLSMLTGLFVAADVFSFYVFFVALLIPLFMLIGIAGEIKKQSWMFRFFIYNFIGSVIFFAVICVLMSQHPQNSGILLGRVARLNFSRGQDYFVWGGIFLAMLSRIPIWPFHYWIASINGAVQNPLVFLAVNLVPLTGVYGLIRFCPKAVPESVGYFLTTLEIIAAISMLFIAFIGLINKDIRYKLFSYITVYYIIYLLGALLPTNRILQNIGYSLFAFLIIVSVIEVLISYIRQEQDITGLSQYGVLCAVPKLSFIFSFFILSAVGFPLSALFINNFVILSYLFRYNLNLGLVIMLAIVVVSAGLLKELHIFKNASGLQPGNVCIRDIGTKAGIGLGIIMILLLISFFNPLLVLGV